VQPDSIQQQPAVHRTQPRQAGQAGHRRRTI
jgi:hypothetical protein